MQRCFAPLGAPLLVTIALGLVAGCRDDRPPLAPRPLVSALTGADVQRGEQLIADYGCIACHTVPGVKAPASRVGPPLENVGLRGYLGGVLPNTPDNLVRWLLDPPAIDPRTAMPNVGLAPDEARDIAAYLLTLH
ncbi:c-type cytochrome [Parapusillimonas sp. SGNA-6]|nr:c-type cytochrome [Parapusillimonas sp. SGNA-6]